MEVVVNFLPHMVICVNEFETRDKQKLTTTWTNTQII